MPSTATFASPAGWQCGAAVDLPPPAAQRLAVCRSTTPPARPTLALLLVTEAAPPRVLARLGDASRAVLHPFVGGAGCEAATAPCVDAVVLVDQADESSCYGTQVWARFSGPGLRSLGFIDEFRVAGPGAESSAECIGSHARLVEEAGTLRIVLPPPLARLRADGSVRPLGGAGVSYRFSAARPPLRRSVP